MTLLRPLKLNMESDEPFSWIVEWVFGSDRIVGVADTIRACVGWRGGFGPAPVLQVMTHQQASSCWSALEKQRIEPKRVLV